MQEEHATVDAHLQKAERMARELEEEMSKETTSATLKKLVAPSSPVEDAAFLMSRVTSSKSSPMNTHTTAMEQMMKGNKKKIRTPKVKVRELGRHNTPTHLHEAAERVKKMRSYAGRARKQASETKK